MCTFHSPVWGVGDIELVRLTGVPDDVGRQMESRLTRQSKTIWTPRCQAGNEPNSFVMFRCFLLPLPKASIYQKATHPAPIYQ